MNTITLTTLNTTTNFLFVDEVEFKFLVFTNVIVLTMHSLTEMLRCLGYMGYRDQDSLMALLHHDTPVQFVHYILHH